MGIGNLKLGIGNTTRAKLQHSIVTDPKTSSIHFSPPQINVLPDRYPECFMGVAQLLVAQPSPTDATKDVKTNDNHAHGNNDPSHTELNGTARVRGRDYHGGRTRVGRVVCHRLNLRRPNSERAVNTQRQLPRLDVFSIRPFTLSEADNNTRAVVPA